MSEVQNPESNSEGSPRAQGPEDVAWDESQSGYSKDYWDLFFEQIGRRWLVRIAISILALLYGAAIYSPLIGGDRPYVLEAIDTQSYNDAQKKIWPATLALGGLLKKDATTYEAERTEGSTQTFDDALTSELAGLTGLASTMREVLPVEQHGPLDEFVASVAGAIELSRAGKSDEAVEAHKATKDAARKIKSEFKVLDPEDPESEGVTLSSQTSYPLLEAISGWEVFFMVLWAFVLLWPLWNRIVNWVVLWGDRTRIRRFRRIKWVTVLGVSTLCALGWHIGVGGETTFHSAPFKDGLTNGEIIAVRAVFPPITYGYAEGHSGENFRPPTWHKSSEVDPETGYFLHGHRVPTPDPITGHMPPASPVEVRYGEPGVNDSSRHLLGTDSAGRDMMVRMLWGARISLAVGIVSAVLLALIGTAVGAVAGYYGGKVDLAISRIIEVIMSVPALFLIIMAAAFVDPEVLPPIFAIVIIIALVRWTGVARLCRGEFLKLRESEFVLAGRAMGFSAPRIIFRHILPNAMGPILVATAFSVAAGILTESAVSFLGFGIQHPMPSWGSLVRESKSAEHWWIQVFPGLMIFITVTCYNLVGDGVRDALDPKMKV